MSSSSDDSGSNAGPTGGAVRYRLSQQQPSIGQQQLPSLACCLDGEQGGAAASGDAAGAAAARDITTYGSGTSRLSRAITIDMPSFSTLGVRTTTMDLPTLTSDSSKAAASASLREKQREQMQSSMEELKMDMIRAVQHAVAKSVAELAASLQGEVREAWKQAACGQLEQMTAVVRSALGDHLHRKKSHDELAEEAATFDMRPNSSANSRWSFMTRGSQGCHSRGEKKKVASCTEGSNGDRTITALEQNLADQILQASGFASTGSSGRATHQSSRRGHHVPSPVPEVGVRAVAASAMFEMRSCSSEPSAPQQDPAKFLGLLPACGPRPAAPGSQRACDAETGEAHQAQSIPHQIEDPEGMLRSGSEETACDAGADKITETQSSSRLAVLTHLTCDELIRVRNEELVEQAATGCGAKDSKSESGGVEVSQAQFSCPLDLKICGIMPWDKERWPRLSALYQICVVGIVLLACSLVLEDAAATRGVLLPQFHHPNHGPERGPLSQMPMAVGALCGTVLLSFSGFRGSPSETLSLLGLYASKQGFLHQWQRRAKFDKCAMFAVWVACVISLMAGALCKSRHAEEDFVGGMAFPWLHKIATSFVCGILLELVFCVLYVCRSLSLMVDTFCCHAVEDLNLSMAVEEWNILQAVLRKASAAIEHGFIILQAVLGITMPLLFADLYLKGVERGAVATLLPTLFAALGVLRMFAHAAVITDKCSRVPSLINSLYFGPGTESERQRTVEYIVNSAAGFYVCGVRLNTGLAMKFVYGWCVIALGLATHFFASDTV